MIKSLYSQHVSSHGGTQIFKVLCKTDKFTTCRL